MSKRKGGVGDIIYELDLDDSNLTSWSRTTSGDTTIDVVNLDCSTEGECILVSPTKDHNGGKTSPDIQHVKTHTNHLSEAPHQTENHVVNDKIIFNDDIVIDSPNSNSDLGVVGCENRRPIVSVKFRDQRLAKACKEEIKAFMLKLIKLHDEANLTGSETETDLELDIWPEDLNEEEKQEEDNLFFVDTAPATELDEIPRYSHNSSLITDAEKEPSPTPVLRRGPSCFNCGGSHPLRDCPMPRNQARINENRKNMVKMGRYHVEDEQKYGHLVPGRISGQLRHALDLKRNELPLFIYRMRQAGYPPAWMEDAKISHSGITMFDSMGKAIQDPDEEDGEVCEPGSKDTYDIKKIFDFPGYNVPASSRYKEEAHKYGMPPISQLDSKLEMLQNLAPNAMKAYKRKKLMFFPSAASNNAAMEGQSEMDLDSGDECVEFPSVPPLPDDVPPLPPPPPDCPPPPDSPPTNTIKEEDDKSGKTHHKKGIDDEIDVIEVTKVTDIPVPEGDWIVIDEDNTSLDDLEDKKQKLLAALKNDVIEQDSDDNIPNDTPPLETTVAKNDTHDLGEADIGKQDSQVNIVADNMNESGKDTQESEAKGSDINKETKSDNNVAADNDINVATESDINMSKTTDSNVTSDSVINVELQLKKLDTIADKLRPDSVVNSPQASTKSQDTDSDSDLSKPAPKTGLVKGTSYGTPVMNIASSYIKLPSDNNFAKDICDVINFENLPNSTGKYKQISDLLKKVKNEVDRIQDT
ncbi:zinc finger CCHC domain-containing protein 8 homolog isoform X2 [Hyposmocoma kahamanoa]|uniref:zinc finger CCHC domain-containing protein 8 homolog isoform X2 n=1 Tax=Hyposmocoma kahamanoa TaxID=1477025 RepID=UPI000E6D866C|nr:zinc finger CCHC domain-containing protein 8 homolog isoform X2 [Hyposmocoma kahamanoa]